MKPSTYSSPGQRTALEREIRAAIGLELRTLYKPIPAVSVEPVPSELAELVAQLVALEADRPGKIDRSDVEALQGTLTGAVLR
jgi:hypothetical protein